MAVEPKGGGEKQAPGEPAGGREQKAPWKLAVRGEQQVSGKPAEGGEQQTPKEAALKGEQQKNCSEQGNYKNKDLCSLKHIFKDF